MITSHRRIARTVRAIKRTRFDGFTVFCSSSAVGQSRREMLLALRQRVPTQIAPTILDLSRIADAYYAHCANRRLTRIDPARRVWLENEHGKRLAHHLGNDAMACFEEGF